MSAPLRVVQWGTGNVGRHALRVVLERPGLQLVGLHVTSAHKVGVDAATLIDRPPVGVRATDSVDAVCAMDADVVLHMPLPAMQVADDPDLDTKNICRLLASGKNVITTTGYVYPKAYGQDVLARLQAACATGATTLHGTGVNPGFMADLMPLVLSGLCERVDKVYVLEASEFSRYPSPEVILAMMGFGKPIDEFESHTARYRAWLSSLFHESLLMVADGLQLPVDDIVAHQETTVAADDLVLAAGPVARGTVAGQRWVWSGRSQGQTVIELEAIYRAHPSVSPEWPTTAWLTRLEGVPNITVELNRWLGNGLLGTAMHAVNAIVPVCTAEPGVRSFLDLPLIVGRGPLSAP